MPLHLLVSGSEKGEDSHYHDFDELAAEYATQTNTSPETDLDGVEDNEVITGNTRNINFILDHSAFVRGIGNIKRWFNDEYIQSNFEAKAGEKIQLNIYIPSYTLHEFDYVKKGNTMMATNAREAIKFIDKFISGEVHNKRPVNGGSGDKGSDGVDLSCYLYIESSQEVGPSWNDCLKYKIHSPLVKEFPNLKTMYDSNLIGQNVASPYASGMEVQHEDIDQGLDRFKKVPNFKYSSKLNTIQYENSESYQHALAHADAEAEMPYRLKYLIRSCVQRKYRNKIDGFKAHPRKSEEWRLVTEDPISKIWVASFGIECLNINEAELMIFQNYDINQPRVSDPHKRFDSEGEEEEPFSILQNTIDTTVYLYSPMLNKQKKPFYKSGKKDAKQGTHARKQEKPKPFPTGKNSKKPFKGVVQEEGTGIHGGVVKKERFDAINFAPRGSGELWRP